MAKDYYAALGIKKTASDKEIKSAFRKLARKYHPDVNPSDKTAEQRFKEINAAHDVISDPAKREKYDRYGENWEQAEAFEKARQQAGAQYGGPGSGSQTFTFDINDLLRRQSGGGGAGGFDVGDMFGSLLRNQRRGPMRGQNVEYATEITLEEAFHGTTRTVSLRTEEPCTTCGASGEIANAVCHTCGGAGAVVHPKRIEVKIPAGARDGTRVRIAREGSAGQGGGPRGDLYVVTRVRPHSRFERKGDNLIEDVPVHVEDAVLGGEVEVETIDGKHIAVTVPPMTQNGRQIRLKGLGMPSLDARKKGDLIARIRLVIPDDITDDERELYEQLRAIRKKEPAGAR